jgi:hypothetical protein
MNSRPVKSAVARCPLITASTRANTATATATKVAFSDLPYLTSLHKRANVTMISNFSNLAMVLKARF